MRKNEKGFGLVEILVIIVVLGLVVAVGWLAINRQSSDKADTVPSVANNQSAQASAAKVGELGLKINDPDNRNMTVRAVDVTPEFSNETVRQYTVTPADYSTKGYDKFCESPVAIFESTGDGNDSSFVKQISNKKYFVSYPIGGCGSDEPGRDTYVRAFRQYVYDNLVAN